SVVFLAMRIAGHAPGLSVALITASFACYALRLSVTYHAQQKILERMDVLQNRYEAAVNASGLVLYDWYPSTNEVMLGGNLSAVLGYSPEEVSRDGSKWRELIHPDDVPRFKKEVDLALASTEPLHIEYRIRKKDGPYVTVKDDGYFITGA